MFLIVSSPAAFLQLKTIKVHVRSLKLCNVQYLVASNFGGPEKTTFIPKHILIKPKAWLRGSRHS